MPTGRLYRRGNKWYLDYYTGRKKTNDEYERVRCKATGKTKADAQTELDEILYKMRRTSRIGGALNNNYPLKSVCDEWCDHIKRTVSNKQIAKEYCRHCERMVEFLEAEFVSDLTLEDAEKAIKKIADERSTNTANKALAKMKSALEYAKDRGIIATNPIKKAKTLKTIRKKFRRALTEEEVNALLKTAPEPWRTIWHFILSTGVRRDEFLYLRRADIDLKKAKIKVCEREEFKPKTNAGSRTIPLGKNIISALHNIKLGNELLFPSEHSEVIIERHKILELFREHITEALKRIAKIRKRWKLPLPEGVKIKGDDFKVDTSQLDLHAMRYTFITELIGAGVDPKSVQYLAGHKDIKTTLAIYAQFKGGNVEDAINNLPWA